MPELAGIFRVESAVWVPCTFSGLIFGRDGYGLRVVGSIEKIADKVRSTTGGRWLETVKDWKLSHPQT